MTHSSELSSSGKSEQRLDSIVQHYIAKHRAPGEAELDRFRSEPSLRACIRRAGLGRSPDVNRSRDQRSIPASVLAEQLLKRSDAMSSCHSFEELFDIVEAEGGRLYGIGEMAVYDMALHIGAYLKLEPTEIYLHGGTRAGARALGFDGARRSLRADELPQGLRRLKPYELENCMRIYAQDLERLRSQQ